ncbi:hypothetical protein QNH48_27715 [Neobacillus sp. YX16]|uniref:hypothetical protein n=1 Tax=Neobacillus sp. YX16 TaxID=3047874 RepID=UPI0024C235D8|nr:hypothetical protein [Neobacillus sp. YX16]WHZ02663.1 hypothetical protein QNH48_27715 [Neobacillus sp. YX16]
MARLVQAIGSDVILEGLTVGFIVGLINLKNTLIGLISKKSFMIAILRSCYHLYTLNGITWFDDVISRSLLIKRSLIETKAMGHTVLFIFI